MNYLSFSHRIPQRSTQKNQLIVYTFIALVHSSAIMDINWEIPPLKTDKVEYMTFVTLPTIDNNRNNKEKVSKVSNLSKLKNSSSQTKSQSAIKSIKSVKKQENQEEQEHQELKNIHATENQPIQKSDTTTNTVSSEISNNQNKQNNEQPKTNENALNPTTEIPSKTEQANNEPEEKAPPRALNAILPPAQTWEYEFISGDFAKKAFYRLEYPTPTTYKTSFEILGPVGISGGRLFSEGAIGVAGFVPQRFEYKTFNKALVALTFIEEEKKIRFSSSEKVIDKPDDVQDFATLPLQVALMAQAYKNQFSVGHQFTMPVAHYKGHLENMTFQVKNIAHFGEVPALHLVRLGGSRREFWLSMVKNSKTGVPTYTLIALLFDMGSRGIYYATIKGYAGLAPKIEILETSETLKALQINKENKKQTDTQTEPKIEEQTLQFKEL
jgi:hypothetical protein